MQINNRLLNIGNNNLESMRLLNITRRSCNDGNKPGERCLWLQVTVNGTNEQISELDGRILNFLVFSSVDPLRPVYTSGAITLRIGERVKNYTKRILKSTGSM